MLSATMCCPTCTLDAGVLQVACGRAASCAACGQALQPVTRAAALALAQQLLGPTRLLRGRVRRAPAGARSKTTCLQLVVASRGDAVLPADHEPPKELVVRWRKGKQASVWQMTIGKSPGNPALFRNRVEPRDKAATRMDLGGQPCTTAALLARHGYGVGDDVELRLMDERGELAIEVAPGPRRGPPEDVDGRCPVQRDHSLQVPKVAPRIPKSMLTNAASWVRAYNRGTYRERRNVELDEEGYRRFARGPAWDASTLAEDVAFVGRFYGGTQEHLLPSKSWELEAAQIAAAIGEDGAAYRRRLRRLPRLVDEVPTVAAVSALIAPFQTPQRSWMVWGSKVLHFLAPETFPQLDAQVEQMLGLPRGAYEAHYYVGFMGACRQVLEQFKGVFPSLREAEARTNTSGGRVSDIKLLDKVLYAASRKRRGKKV